ncbi:MAG: hypothetical protein SGPRY_004585, partial [Prymnesium sp.]
KESLKSHPRPAGGQDLRMLRARSALSGASAVGWRRGLCDAFRASWTLPYRQVPWALPFTVTQAEARSAFERWSGAGSPGVPKLTVKNVRPIHVPYYVFEGQLDVTFKGVIGYNQRESGQEMREYRCADIRCPSVHLGADTGPTTAVYAGFDFRRLYVRQALSPDLSDELLKDAVPFNELTNKPTGAGVEAFQMKPSFAYLNRILERLPDIAYHEAERVMEQPSVRAALFHAEDGSTVCPAHESRPPEYACKIPTQLARASYRVCALPTCAVTGSTRLHGSCPTGRKRMHGGRALAAATSAGFVQVEAVRWPLTKTTACLASLAILLRPQLLVSVQLVTRGQAKLTAHCVSSTAVGAAFRALAMTAHPDRLQQALAVRQGSRFNLSAHVTPPFPVLQGQSEVEMAKCTQRFQDLLAAHARLRRKHSNTN